MTQPKHTPGPWSDTYRFTARRKHLEVYGSDSSGIAQIGLRVGQETAEANARLIAAAPELLEALQWAVRVVRLGPGSDPDDFARRYNEANATIAKATGE